MKHKYRVIELTKGFVAIIDADDFHRVNKFSWNTHRSAGKGRKQGNPYARGRVKGKLTYLHRFVMGEVPVEMHVDHLNHQTLDCRKSNLEIVTNTENQKRRRDRKNG